jgi:hypothetical protein
LKGIDKPKIQAHTPNLTLISSSTSAATCHKLMPFIYFISFPTYLCEENNYLLGTIPYMFH